MAKTKRQRRCGRETEEEKDILSNLPDYILLHIMKFMDTSYAVQTCVLSKRWKDLWKRLTSLSFRHYNRILTYNKFVSHVMSFRDDSYLLLSLDLIVFRSTAHKLLNKVIEYAALSNIQQLTIATDFQFRNIPNSFVHLIFSCQSLTFLDLSIGHSNTSFELPKSLMLPALKTLHLTNVSFTASDNDNDYAEPFSTCNLLNTLVLQDCTLHRDAKVLHISNSNLSSLKLDNMISRGPFQPETLLNTPNLSSISIVDNMLFTYPKLSSTCNFLFLEEVNIFRRYSTDPSVLISWLPVFSNLKILTLSSCTVNMILRELSNLATNEIQPPCFVRLESLKIKMCPYNIVSDAGVKRVVKYLLRNSPLIRADAAMRWKILGNLRCCSYNSCFVNDLRRMH